MMATLSSTSSRAVVSYQVLSRHFSILSHIVGGVRYELVNARNRLRRTGIHLVRYEHGDATRQQEPPFLTSGEARVSNIQGLD